MISGWLQYEIPLRIRKWFKTKLVKIMLGSESESIIDWSIVAPSNFPKLILVNFSGFFIFVIRFIFDFVCSFQFLLTFLSNVISSAVNCIENRFWRTHFIPKINKFHLKRFDVDISNGIVLVLPLSSLAFLSPYTTNIQRSSVLPSS